MKLVDSSCLVCVFTEINRSFILMDWIKRGYQIVITDEVYREIQNNEKTNKIISPEIKKGNIKINNGISKQELELFRTRFPMLGVGERSIILESLKLNKSKKRYYAILDDGAARKIASKLMGGLL